MKKIFIYVLLLSILSACGKDFLEINPRTQLSEAEFYENESQVMMALYSIIHSTQTSVIPLYNNFIYLSDEGTTGGGPGENTERVHNYQWDATNAPGWWASMYVAIAKTNIVLSKLEKATINEDTKSRIRAEVRFYRALFYSYLFYIYEECIIVDKPLSPSEFYTQTQSPRADVYKFIMDDIEAAKGKLIDEPKVNADYGRIINDAVLMLKAKMILFAKDESRYGEIYNELASVIRSGKYQLVPDFKELWLKGCEFSSESIMEVVFSSKGNNNNWGNMDAGEGNVIPRQNSGRDLIDPRSESEGGLTGGWGMGTVRRNVYEWYEAGDTRRDGTFIDYEVEKQKVAALYPNSAFQVADNQLGYQGLGNFKYHARKGYSSTTAEPMLNHDPNYRFYRYSDMLLLGAELKIRIDGQADTEAEGWFNQVRDRAFGEMNVPKANKQHNIAIASMNKQDALDVIFKERGLELAYEMNRYMDIIRFDKGQEILSSDGINKNSQWTPKYIFFPIQQSELERTKGTMQQNPTWR